MDIELKSGYREHVLNRLHKVMTDNNLDMLILSTFENIFYATGFRSTAERAVALLNNDGIYGMVIPYFEAPSARKFFGDSVHLYFFGNFKFSFHEESEDEFTTYLQEMEELCFSDYDEALAYAIENSGISIGRVGIDENFITFVSWNALVEKFNNIVFSPAADIIYNARKIKHPYEIECLERAAAIVEQSIIAVTQQLQKGMSEQDLGWIFNAEVSKRRADVFFNVIAIDEHGAFADTQRTDKKIRKGSHIRFDVSCDYLGYKSDIARTAVISDYNKMIEQTYDIISQGQECAIDALRPGVRVCDIYNIAMSKIRKEIPSYRRNHVGHGIGVEMYDKPLITKDNTDILEPGMVISIETPFYLIGSGSAQVEDTILITDEGHRMLSKSSRNIIKIEL